MEYHPQKLQKYWKSKNGVKTTERPLFKELWAILEKSDLEDDFEIKSER